MKPGRPAALPVLLVLAVTGCGSTVQPVDRPGASLPASGSSPDGFAIATPSSDGGQTISTTGGTGTTSGSGMEAAAGSTGSGLTTETTASPTTPRGLSGPGVTAKTITFGVVYDTSNAGGNASLGIDVNPGDLRQYYSAVAADVNAHGGILGRKLVPAYLGQSSTSTATADTNAQEVCDTFTRDKPSLAILGQSSPLIRDCTRKAHVLDVFDGASAAGAQTFADHPGYVEPASINLDRVGPVTVNGLAKTDYFSGKPKVGIVVWDDKAYRHSVDVGWKPSLSEIGHAAADTAYIPVPHSSSDLSSSSAAISSAALRFSSEGITHVLILDGPAGVFSGTGLTLLWLKGAGSQQYYPRYGFNTNNSADAGYDAGLWNARDIKDARYVTWASYSAATDQGIPANPSRTTCEAIMRKAGIDVSDVAKLAAALAACDEVWVLRDSLNRGSGDATLDGAVKGLNTLGTSLRSARSYGTRFASDRHDGVAAVRLAYFVNSAWQYRGQPFSTDH